MMKNKSIGIITKVFFNKIVVEAPSPSDIQHNYKGDLYTLEGLNDYITIYKDQKNKYIYQITGLYEQEKPMLSVEESKFERNAYFEAIPVGEIYHDQFEYGLSIFPIIGEDVYLTTRDDIQKILTSKNNTLPISFGKLTTHEYIPEFPVDSLFTNHFAILGNTGSGKSTTVRKILNELLNLKDRNIDPNEMNFVIFDVHNEYTVFNEQYLTKVDLNEISIPLNTLKLEDWINLVQPATRVQLPILMNGLKMASILESDNESSKWLKAYCALELYNNQQTDAVAKRTKIISLVSGISDEEVQSSVEEYDSRFGNFTQQNETRFRQAIKSYIKRVHGLDYHECEGKVQETLETANQGFKKLEKLKDGINMVILLEEAKGNTQVKANCETLMTRIDSIILNYSSNLLDNNENKISKFNKIIEYKKALTVFDCSSLESTDLLFFSGYLSRDILESQKSIRKERNLNKMFNIILDEAHQYIKEGNDDAKSNSTIIFNNIAKEGRKFGVFIAVASQRPSELSKTVLSQCNNFILHRIRNNLDLDQLRKSIPYISDSQVFRLSFLKTGVALLVGDSFTVPMEMHIDEEDLGEISETVTPSVLWSYPKN